MSKTLVISEHLFQSLDRTARDRGLDGVEALLAKVAESPVNGNDREAIEQVRALRERLHTKYGLLPDSLDLLREDRDLGSW